MKPIIALGCLLLIAVPATAQLAPYWIPDDGCELVCKGIHTPAVYYEGSASPVCRKFSTDGEYYRYDYYFSDGEGGLLATTEEYPGMEYDTYVYSPPLKVLDLPLTPGKTWTSVSVRSRQGGGTIPRTHTLVSTVLGARTIDTVVGPLDVVEVIQELTVVPGPGGTTTVTRLLNEQLGDVHGLIATDGCSLVAVEESSWGCVKGLFR